MSRTRRRNRGHRMVACGICGQPVTYERLNEHRASCTPRRREAPPDPRELQDVSDDDESEETP